MKLFMNWCGGGLLVGYIIGAVISAATGWEVKTGNHVLAIIGAIFLLK